MNAIEEIKKSLLESYKWFYTEAIEDMKYCLVLAKKRREQGYRGWAADWLEDANHAYKRARDYKRSIEFYSR